MADEVDILIVDDDVVFGELCVERLEDAGYTAHLLHGPFGTVNEVRRRKPRLLILDVNMPGVPGDKAAELVQALKLPSLRIMFMSSLGNDELEEIRRRTGADACLTKSARAPELIGMVRSLIGGPTS